MQSSMHVTFNPVSLLLYVLCLAGTLADMLIIYIIHGINIPAQDWYIEACLIVYVLIAANWAYYCLGAGNLAMFVYFTCIFVIVTAGVVFAK